MAEVDFTHSPTSEAATAWGQFDESYHRVQTLLDAIESIAVSRIDLTAQEVRNDASRWAPFFQEQISSIYNLADLLGKTLEKDLCQAAVGVRVAGQPASDCQ
ncbi:hypothetical protein [Ralstonia thomasii]